MEGVTILILAGGEGRRMGGSKTQRQLAGKSLLDHAIMRARNWGEEPVVAMRCGRDIGRCDARMIGDKPWLQGPLAGLASGVEDALRRHHDMLLLLPADMPFLPDDMPQRLARALIDAEPGTGCAMASSNGRHHPVCSLWRLDLLASALPAYVAKGRRSLIGIAETVRLVAVEWPAAREQDPFFNINSPDDLARAEARMR